jgi:hypothetical protein
MPEENKAEALAPEMTGATRSAETARALIRKAKRATRRRFPTERKIRIVMEGVRGEVEKCRWRNFAVARASIPRSTTSG